MLTLRNPPKAALPKKLTLTEAEWNHQKTTTMTYQLVPPGVKPELDDLSDELRRQEVRELRRQRLGEGGEVGAFVVLEATGVENPAEVRVFAEWPARFLFWKLVGQSVKVPSHGPVGALRRQ